MASILCGVSLSALALWGLDMTTQTTKYLMFIDQGKGEFQFFDEWKECLNISRNAAGSHNKPVTIYECKPLRHLERMTSEKDLTS